MERYQSLKVRFIRNISYKTIADFISRLATVFVTVFLTRKLTQEQFGLFSYGLAFAMTCVLMMDFGWNSVLVRKAKQPNFATALLSVFSLKVGILVLTVLLFTALPFLLPTKIPLAIFLGCYFYASSISFQDYQGAAIAGLERFDLEWIFKIIPRWVPFLLLLWLLKGNPTPVFASLLIGVSALGITLVMIAVLFKSILKESALFSKEDIQVLLKEGAPFGLAALVWGIYTRLDVMLLGFYDFPLDQIGVYSAAIKIVDFSRGLAMIFYVAMIPIFNDYHQNLKGLRRIILKISAGFMVLLLLSLPLIYKGTPFVINLIYGEAYAGGSLPLALALTGMLLFLMNTPFLAAFVSLGRGKLALLGSSLMLLTCFTVNLWLLPNKGLMAPSWAIVAAEAMWLFLNAFFLFARLK